MAENKKKLARRAVPGCTSTELTAFRSLSTPCDVQPTARGADSGHEPIRAVMHWPLKLRLAQTDEPGFKSGHFLIAADCTAFACRCFHESVAIDRIMLIACTRFDNPAELLDKMQALCVSARPASITVVRMEKDCCKGLYTVCHEAVESSGLAIALDQIVVTGDGRILPG